MEHCHSEAAAGDRGGRKAAASLGRHGATRPSGSPTTPQSAAVASHSAGGWAAPVCHFRRGIDGDPPLLAVTRRGAASTARAVAGPAEVTGAMAVAAAAVRVYDRPLGDALRRGGSGGVAPAADERPPSATAAAAANPAATSVPPPPSNIGTPLPPPPTPPPPTPEVAWTPGRQPAGTATPTGRRSRRRRRRQRHPWGLPPQRSACPTAQRPPPTPGAPCSPSRLEDPCHGGDGVGSFQTREGGGWGGLARRRR